MRARYRDRRDDAPHEAIDVVHTLAEQYRLHLQRRLRRPLIGRGTRVVDAGRVGHRACLASGVDASVTSSFREHRTTSPV